MLEDEDYLKVVEITEAALRLTKQHFASKTRQLFVDTTAWLLFSVVQTNDLGVNSDLQARQRVAVGLLHLLAACVTVEAQGKARSQDRNVETILMAWGADDDRQAERIRDAAKLPPIIPQTTPQV